MTVSPIQNQPNPASSSGASAKLRAPQGVAQTADRLEDRRAPEHPPSVFKEYLFKPIFLVIKFILRGIFTLIDCLRKSAYEEKSEEPVFDREAFLDRLRSAPRPEKILVQFAEAYSPAEQNQIYLAIGEAHAAKTSWKEVIWNRSSDENIDLGRRLVRQNPFILRDHL
jgi:hypothetical protein